MIKMNLGLQNDHSAQVGLILLGKSIPYLLLSFQQKKQQHHQRHTDAYHGKIFTPVTRRLISRVTYKSHDRHIDKQYSWKHNIFLDFSFHPIKF